MKFTPGPWRVAPAAEYVGAALNVDASTRAYICSAGIRGDNEAEANAQLIAAAPDLLQSLSNLVGLAEIRGPIHEYKAALTDAKEVIARAGGPLRLPN